MNTHQLFCLKYINSKRINLKNAIIIYENAIRKCEICKIVQHSWSIINALCFYTCTQKRLLIYIDKNTKPFFIVSKRKRKKWMQKKKLLKKMEKKNVFVMCMIIISVCSSLMVSRVDCRALRSKPFEEIKGQYRSEAAMKVKNNSSSRQHPLTRSYAFRLASGPSKRGRGHWSIISLFTTFSIFWSLYSSCYTFVRVFKFVNLKFCVKEKKRMIHPWRIGDVVKEVSSFIHPFHVNVWFMNSWKMIQRQKLELWRK